MKHSINELYKTGRNTFCTHDYIEMKKLEEYKKVMFLVNRNEIEVHTVGGIKVAYMYGEKTWFDTKEERDIYREEQAKARAELVAKNKVIKAINEKLKEMSEEELVKLLEKM